jgi:hypothetical protein
MYRNYFSNFRKTYLEFVSLMKIQISIEMYRLNVASVKLNMLYTEKFTHYTYQCFAEVIFLE